MINPLLIASITILVFGILKAISLKKRKINLKTIISLFLFGILLSLPFVLIKNLTFDLRSYLVILAFIGVELIIVSIEHQWEYLHKLLHHNIKEFRLLSFFIVGLGFTYSELFFYIINSQETLLQLVATIPMKALFAISTHTILTSSAAVLTATESIMEHIMLFFIYYLRLIFISVSHYLYVFFSENKITYLIIPFLIYNLYLLLKHKKYLDKKGIIIE